MILDCLIINAETYKYVKAVKVVKELAGTTDMLLSRSERIVAELTILQLTSVSTRLLQLIAELFAPDNTAPFMEKADGFKIAQ